MIKAVWIESDGVEAKESFDSVKPRVQAFSHVGPFGLSLGQKAPATQDQINLLELLMKMYPNETLHAFTNLASQAGLSVNLRKLLTLAELDAAAAKDKT